LRGLNLNPAPLRADAAFETTDKQGGRDGKKRNTSSLSSGGNVGKTTASASGKGPSSKMISLNLEKKQEVGVQTIVEGRERL